MSHLEVAKNVFEVESQAVLDLSNSLNNDFTDAVNSILNSDGRLIVCGMGKSGIIGKKIAATLASTGTPSFFMHPGEAYHGDLGMVTSSDLFLALSNSGETQEVTKLIPFLKSNKNILISMTGNPKSTLACASRYHLNVGVKIEACPLQLTPTASTTATLAMGDALAVALMTARGFQPENFARFHPGGTLGRRLLSCVEDEMHTDNLPFVNADSSMLDLISTITRCRLGVCIIDGETRGIVTDGDLRRAIQTHGEAFFEKEAQEIMSLEPTTIEADEKMENALLTMHKLNITTLLVTRGESIVGVLKK